MDRDDGLGGFLPPLSRMRERVESMRDLCISDMVFEV